MAVGFGGTTRYTAPFSIISDYPFSMFIAARHNSIATEGVAFQYSQQPLSSDVNQTIDFRGDTAGDPVQYRRGNNDTSTTSVVNSAAGFSANVWASIGASSSGSSAASAAVYLNGTKTSTASGTTIFGTRLSSQIVLGAFVSSSAYSTFLNGGAFRAAMWSATLTDAEMVSLARGFSPRRVRPQSLRYYAPLIRNVQDLIAAITHTATNAAAAVDSPRAYGY